MNKKDYQKRYYQLNKEAYRKRGRKWINNHLWVRHYTLAKKRCTSGKYFGRVLFKMSKDDFKKLWFRDKAWLLKQPSIHRIDNDSDYIYDNCRFIELEENTRLGNKNRDMTTTWEGLRKYHIRMGWKVTPNQEQEGEMREKEQDNPQFNITDRGFNVKCWYLKDTLESKGDALVIITKDEKVLREFIYPAYKIWNIAAHFRDIVDSELENTNEGYKTAGSDGLGGCIMPEKLTP